MDLRLEVEFSKAELTEQIDSLKIKLINHGLFLRKSKIK